MSDIQAYENNRLREVCKHELQDAKSRAEPASLRITELQAKGAFAAN
ncbi:hypothetical protein EYZ11_005175 [Aspergillus tanneri]|uniref:Uncharacterized protein n=1 Tax=Aspergillus tanneri TaxID=1220188 RepID=A0A4S3JPI6_9EURO|nr:hypothetical protein EYZ11_005175 [Aspergillus tanneri]